MLQKIHPPIAAREGNRIGSQVDYTLVYAAFLLLVFVAAAASAYFGESRLPDPSIYATG
jgi:hypothetical protein